MKIYLDNCTYNRPYDDQSQMRIYLETQAKLHIQDMIREEKLELATSYILDYENSRNRSLPKKMAIEKFIRDHTAIYVSVRNKDRIKKYASAIMQTGVKEKDAYHVACSIIAGCKYFITTDDRLLRYHSEKVILVTPGEFIRRMEADNG